MSRMLYLECGSGISGDMTVAALLDLGADREVLRAALDSLELEGFRTEIARVKKSGLDACDFRVVLDEKHENHDHDMEYLHGHGHEHVHEHTQEHDHGHEHVHEHTHEHTHEHRGLPEILSILEHGKMTERARALAKRIFTILGEAEAKAHGVPLEQVHFHEVGAVDSIVDIVAAAVCLDNLDIEETVIQELCEGGGFVRCQHGEIPVPVPAVLNITAAYGLQLHMTGIRGELVTPTGAAIAAAVCTRNRLPERFRIAGVGLGAGKRTYERPSLLRAMLIEEIRETEDTICKLECNIDDCTGEMLGHAMDCLFEAGARDVHYIPVYMKKNRPAWQLNVICSEQDREKMEEIIFRETSTIGIRRMRMERTVMEREICCVETPLGSAKVKKCRYEKTERCYPEYESVVRLCRESGKSFGEVYQMILGAVGEAGRGGSL
ncbi:MAG: nickel pincer cofactor biosynthesis protein LarC [Fusicatenibacter sp.]|nr:nickel pincer cofactor biosynthesis protein LarC [Fusicatenibacter sp.]